MAFCLSLVAAGFDPERERGSGPGIREITIFCMRELRAAALRCDDIAKDRRRSVLLAGIAVAAAALSFFVHPPWLALVTLGIAFCCASVTVGYLTFLVPQWRKARALRDTIDKARSYEPRAVKPRGHAAEGSEDVGARAGVCGSARIDGRDEGDASDTRVGK